MKNRFFISLLIIAFAALLFPSSSYSDIKTNAANAKKNPDVVDEIERRENILIKKLAKEKDPLKRMEYIGKLKSLYALHFDPEIRVAYVRKQNPYFDKIYGKDYAKKANLGEFDETNSARKEELPALNIMTATGKDWELYSAEDKIKFCRQIKKECDRNNNMEYCRFTISKCKSFIPKVEYDGLIARFLKKDEDLEETTVKP